MGWNGKKQSILVSQGSPYLWMYLATLSTFFFTRFYFITIADCYLCFERVFFPLSLSSFSLFVLRNSLFKIILTSIFLLPFVFHWFVFGCIFTLLHRTTSQHISARFFFLSQHNRSDFYCAGKCEI